MKKIFVAIILIIAIIGWSLVGLSFVSGSTTEKPFDHSQCQYPFRTTNPIDACDNSDPACPAEIKGGSCEVVSETVAPEVVPEEIKVVTCKQ